ncbi:formin-like protein 2 [Danio aesculapii]|uniref:formin-like protein 2 n=1 Tax=Danio aesculapii TaxID=1142201 RepID=UPI0024C07EC8|nr:formin-like protein 2 [Danio aesculapii]
MGNAGSMNQHTDPRGHHMPLKLPMPEPAELEERFALVLNSMNLPPDKARLLRQYDNEKKWELICDQERFQVKNPPHTYIHKLQSYLDPAVTRKKFRRRVQESTQVLRELEISLRTNHIGWVREFLNEENKGLDVLVEYLSFAQYAVTYDGDSSENSTENSVDKSKAWSRSIEDLHGGNHLSSGGSGSNISRTNRHSTIRSNTLPSRRTLKNSRLVCKKDDVHVCIMCLRAIMNYQYGFNMVMSHPHAVNEIALSLNNKNPRTKALVLELLAAVCLVRGGHEIILSAFDHFKECVAVKIKKPIKTKFRMPVFNWVALKPNQINGTVFNEIDDERILEDLNVDEFEEMFKTKAQGPAIDITSSKQKTSQKGPHKISLLDANRSKNLAITLRKVGKTSEEICRGIQLFDLRTLPVDFVECLMRFIPTEAELKVLRQYEKERKPLENLTDEDRFMIQFSKIERLMQKMTIMAFVGNFTESIQMLTPQLHAVIAASVSIKSSQKLKKILEIILALGNYMNSSKRGAVYGFKLQSLDLLLDTKSTDRKITLLHYIANVVKDKYQQVSLFYNELNYVEKAAAVSLENVLLDVKELQRGMDLTRKEYSMHGHNTLLKDFIQQNENKLKKLQDDAKIAQDAFDEVVKFFGENAKTTPPSVFFPVFVRFVKAYRQAEEDNEQKKRHEQMMMEKLIEQEAMMEQEDQKSPSHKNKRQQQELIAELRKKQVKDSRHVYEGKDGAIEDIITDLRNQPYRRADAVRRSVRRRFDDPNLRPVNNAEMVM